MSFHNIVTFDGFSCVTHSSYIFWAKRSLLCLRLAFVVVPLHLLIKIWIMNILIAGFLFSLIQILVFRCMKVVSYQTSFHMDASTSLSVFLSVSVCLSVSLSFRTGRFESKTNPRPLVY